MTKNNMKELAELYGLACKKEELYEMQKRAIQQRLANAEEDDEVKDVLMDAIASFNILIKSSSDDKKQYLRLIEQREALYENAYEKYMNEVQQ